MKKIKFLVAAFIAVALSASCSSDDSEDLLGGDLTARWNQTKTVIKISGESFTQEYDSNEPGCDKDYIEFTDGGQLNDVIFFRNASDVCTEDASTPQTYTRADNTLVISGGEFGGTYEIIRLTNSELRIQQSSSSAGITTTTTVYFSKAAM